MHKNLLHPSAIGPEEIRIKVSISRAKWICCKRDSWDSKWLSLLMDLKYLMEKIMLKQMVISNQLLCLIDYYGIVFKAKDLSKKEYEFRNNKLSLILNLIDTVKVPEDLMAELRSTIIASWRLRIPGSTREKRSGEISMVLQTSSDCAPPSNGQRSIRVLTSDGSLMLLYCIPYR